MSSNRIVHKVTLKYLLQNRKRSLFSLVSIILMVILLTGVFIGKDTAIRFFTDIAEAEKGEWHINVYDIDNEQYEKLKALPFVEETGISSHLALSQYSDSANIYKPYLDLRSYSRNSLDWMNITVTEGRMPETDDEILLSEAVTEDGTSVNIGDQIHFSGITRSITNSSEYQKVFPFQQIMMEPWETREVSSDFPYFPNDPEVTETTEQDGFEKTYTVCGFMETPSFESLSSAVYTAITYSEEVPVSGTFNLSMRVSEEDANLYSSINEIAPNQFEANNYVLIFHGQSTSYSINLVVIMMEVFLVSLILIISVVLMNNVFALSYDERLKYLGMLSSIGATGRQKRSSVYFEALVLLAIALPVGFVLGLLAVKAAVSFMRPAAAAFMGLHMTKTVPVTLSLKLTSVLAVVLCSILTVLVSAILPARKISKIGAFESIRGNEKEKNKAQKNSHTYRSAEAMLAHGFLKKEKRRSSAIVKALAAFITVMITVSYAANALIQMAGYKLNETDGAAMKSFGDHEYFLYAGDPDLFGSLVSQLNSTGGVENAEVMYDLNTVAVTPGEMYSDEFLKAYRDVISRYYPEGLSDEVYEQEYAKDQSFWTDFIAVEDEKFNKILKSLNAVPAETDLPQVILVKDGAVSTVFYSVWQRQAQDYRYYEISDMTVCQPGDVFVSEFGPEKTEFTVSAKASQKQISEWFDFSGEKLTGILRLSEAEELISEKGIPGGDRYYIFDGDETNKAFISILREFRSGPDHDYMLVSHEDYLPETIKTSLKALIQVLLVSFTVLASAVCFLNIFNSIGGLISYRRKTFAILKANGMTDAQMKKTMAMEMGIICLKSIVYASVISFVLCFGIKRFVSSAFGNFTIDIPYSGIILTVLAAVMMTALSGWYTYRKELSGNLIEEIRKDSI